MSVCQVEEGIPKPIASGDSLATIQEKLGKFKRLQGQLSDERPTVFQVKIECPLPPLLCLAVSVGFCSVLNVSHSCLQSVIPLLPVNL